MLVIPADNHTIEEVQSAVSLLRALAQIIKREDLSRSSNCCKAFGGDGRNADLATAAPGR
jgi:hypothetical protein